jgi:hypothetical protein
LTKSAEEDLLKRAYAWGENEVVNWSKLARDYGIATSNGGQSIKEFLSGYNIPVALQEQRTQRSVRRRRKVLPGGVPFPMQRSSTFLKKKLFSQVQSGELVQGVNVVPTSVPSFTTNKSEKTVSQTTTTVFAKKIPLLDIRKKLLEKHEKLGIVCTHPVRIWN